jgi:hypothetical protein
MMATSCGVETITAPVQDPIQRQLPCPTLSLHSRTRKRLTIDYDELSQTERDIASPGWRINHQHVQLVPSPSFPIHVEQQLLHGFHDHHPAPHDGRVGVVYFLVVVHACWRRGRVGEEETHGHAGDTVCSEGG